MKSTLSFAVALLAGGRSRRMGTDKGRLMDATTGLEWWRSRLEVLRELGAEEVMISCRPDQTHFQQMVPELRLVHDLRPDSGPLGGIVSGLESMAAELLVVLGVDMLRMTSAVLRKLLDKCGPGRGAVFHNGRFFEPLAAVYPKTMLPDGRRRMERGDLSLQPWLRQGTEEGFLTALRVTAADTHFFENLNSPEFARPGNNEI